jgi:uncharacterized protein
LLWFFTYKKQHKDFTGGSMKTGRQNTLSKNEISRVLHAHQKDLLKYKVKKIGLFGSYVRGRQNKRSDIDMLVDFDLSAFGKDFLGYADNYQELCEFLKKILGKPVDVVTGDMVSPHVKPYVFKEIEYIEAG